jgi:hypothetical protein
MRLPSARGCPLLLSSLGCLPLISALQLRTCFKSVSQVVDGLHALHNNHPTTTQVVDGLHALHERASPAHVVHSLQLLWDPVAAGKKGAMRPRTPGEKEPSIDPQSTLDWYY